MKASKLRNVSLSLQALDIMAALPPATYIVSRQWPLPGSPLRSGPSVQGYRVPQFAQGVVTFVWNCRAPPEATETGVNRHDSCVNASTPLNLRAPERAILRPVVPAGLSLDRASS